MYRSVLVVAAGLCFCAPWVSGSVVVVRSERTAQAASRVFPVGGVETGDAYVQTTLDAGFFDRTGDTAVAAPGLPGLFARARVEHTSLVTPTLITGVSQMSAEIGPPLPAPHQFDIRGAAVASVLDATFDVLEPTPFTLAAAISAQRSLLSMQPYVWVGLLDGNGVFLFAAEINPNSGIDQREIDASGSLAPGRYRLVASAATNLDGDSPFEPAVTFDAAWSVTLTVPAPGAAVVLVGLPLALSRRRRAVALR